MQGKDVLTRFSRSGLRGILILLVFILPVQNEFGSNSGYQTVNKSCYLSSRYDLMVDEFTMQLEDQVDDLGRIHSLLDILCKRHLVNANLVW